jgi:hypothetical protein
MARGANNCGNEDVVEKPAIYSGLKVESNWRAEIHTEGRLSCENAGEQPTANVILKDESASAGVLWRICFGCHGHLSRVK